MSDTKLYLLKVNFPVFIITFLLFLAFEMSLVSKIFAFLGLFCMADDLEDFLLNF